MSDLSRRGFLASVAAGSAGLLLAYHVPGLAASAEGTVVNLWLRIDPDGRITVFNTTTELGQGAATPLAQVMAEELEVGLEQIVVEQAPVAPAYFAKSARGAVYQVTWGSSGSRRNFGGRRTAAAAARMMLVAAAAQRWSVPVEQCHAAQGRVLHAASGQSLGYGELASAAAKLPVPAKPVLKPRSQWTLIGKPLARRDLPAKVDGSARYGIDTILPGMLVATIMQSPVPGGSLRALDPKPAMRIKGVKQVVQLANAVAVVASGYWQAKKGLAALKPVWEAGANKGADSAAHSRALLAGVNAPLHTFTSKERDAARVGKDYENGMASAVARHEALFEAPFLSHAPLEPMNGTALVKPGACELWLPTQYQSMTQEVVAETLGLKAGQVTLNTTLAGGGFGRRIEVDYAVQAAQIAQRLPGRPIKLIWSREEDLSQGFYRGAAMARLRAGLDADGLPCALGFDAACTSIDDYSIVKRQRVPGQPDLGGVDYADETAYALGAQQLRLAPVDLGVPVTFWRSVHASTNGFFLEAFIDELAFMAKADPLDYRRRMLKGKPRALGVLDKLASAHWNEAPAAGRFRGMAMYFAGDTIVAEAIEISVRPDKQAKLERITCVVDCGVVLNPDSVRAQMQGGIIFGLSAALAGEITYKDGVVQQSNFHNYPLLTLAQTPRIDVHLLETGDALGGVGEESVPQVAPALAAALFAASGERIRSLPLTRHGWQFVG